MNAAKLRRIVFGTIVALFALWALLLTFVPQARQDTLFVFDGRTPMLDFNFLVRPLSVPNFYSGEDMPPVYDAPHVVLARPDICNPPLPMFYAAAFGENFSGGCLFTAVNAILYLLSCALFLGTRAGGKRGAAAAVLALSGPFLMCANVGNATFAAAAGAMAFLAWYDSGIPLRRTLAALALALAFAFKLSPAVLGMLYLTGDRRRNLPFAVLAAILGLVFLVVPFAFCGGLESLALWRENAILNASTHAWRNLFGVNGVLFGVCQLAGSWQPYVRFHVLSRNLSAAFAVFMLVACFPSKRDAGVRMTLAAAAMLLLPPTMMYYTLLYFLPVALLGLWHVNPRVRIVSAVAFVVTASPLRICWGSGCISVPAMAVGLLLPCLLPAFDRD